MKECIKKCSISYPAIRYVVLATLFLLAPQTAAALSIAPPDVEIGAKLDEDLFTQEQICLDESCAFVLGPAQSFDGFSLKRAHEQEKEERLSFRGIVQLESGSIRITKSSNQAREDVPFDEVALVEALGVLIEDDISAIRPILLHAFEDWDESGIEPLTVAHRESYEGRILKARKNGLFNCYFTEYEQEGDWLVAQEMSSKREYCFPSEGPNPVGYADLTIRHSHFLFFLFSHIHEIATHYLIGLIVTLFGVLAFGYHLIKRGEVWQFLKPTIAKVTITVIAGTIITFLFFNVATTSFVQPDSDYFVSTWVLEYLIEIYLLLCLIGYIRHRRKTVRAT